MNRRRTREARDLTSAMALPCISHRKHEQNPAGYLYVIARPDGTVKLGRTTDPATRLRTHRRTSGIDRVYVSVSVDYSCDAEYEALAEVRSLLATAERGEAFRHVTFDDAVTIVRGVTKSGVRRRAPLRSLALLPSLPDYPRAAA